MHAGRGQRSRSDTAVWATRSEPPAVHCERLQRAQRAQIELGRGAAADPKRAEGGKFGQRIDVADVEILQRERGDGQLEEEEGRPKPGPPEALLDRQLQALQASQTQQTAQMLEVELGHHADREEAQGGEEA